MPEPRWRYIGCSNAGGYYCDGCVIGGKPETSKPAQPDCRATFEDQLGNRQVVQRLEASQPLAGQTGLFEATS